MQLSAHKSRLYTFLIPTDSATQGAHHVLRAPTYVLSYHKYLSVIPTVQHCYIIELEKVQRRATKMIQGYKDLSYEERLIRCGLTKLEKRRSRGDLIEAYKIITGKESIQWERFFELALSKGTRGLRYKLFKKRKGTIGQKFFSARVVDLWNELDDSTVSVDNVTAFKRKLGKLGY